MCGPEVFRSVRNVPDVAQWLFDLRPTKPGVVILRKRFYIMLVARNAEGELLKIPVPMHYLYVFVAGALIGMLTITGMLGSYTRMVVKTQRFNQLRDEQKALKSQYSQLEQIAQENELQAQSLSSLAGEVSSLYGLKPDPAFQDDDPASASLQQFYALRNTAMTGAASVGIGMGAVSDTSTRDWMRLAAAPTLWPVQGRVTGFLASALIRSAASERSIAAWTFPAIMALALLLRRTALSTF